MLSYLKRGVGSACLAAVLAMAGTAAHAEVHTILIFNDGYFPEVSYVKDGDTVVFENASDFQQTVKARNDSWVLPTLSAGGTADLVITANMHSTFMTPENPEVLGNFNYDDPPLN